MSDFLLRPVTEADAPALLAIYAPYVRNTAITFEYEVPTEAEFARRIRTTLTRFPYLAAVRDGEITPNGADLTPIADGERYELTLTKGSW